MVPKKTMRTIRITGASLIVVLSVFAIGAYLVGSRLIATRPLTVGPVPPDLSGVCVLIPSQSGSTLHGWFLPGRYGAVILMHGLRASRLSQLDRARLFVSEGYSVLLFDFQGHGESPGTNVTFGYLESRDARAAVEYVQARLPGQPIAVVGQSMGAAAAVLADPSLQVDALVLEEMYADLDDAVDNRIVARLGRFAWILSPALTVQVEPRLGFPPSALRPIDRVGSLTMPKLFIAGEDDELTRLTESEALFDAAASPRELWIVNGAHHVDYYTYAPAAYRRHVLRFLKQNLNASDAT